MARSRRELHTLDMTQPGATQEALAIMATLKVSTDTVVFAAAVATGGPNLSILSEVVAGAETWRDVIFTEGIRERTRFRWNEQRRPPWATEPGRALAYDIVFADEVSLLVELGVPVHPAASIVALLLPAGARDARPMQQLRGHLQNPKYDAPLDSVVAFSMGTVLLDLNQAFLGVEDPTDPGWKRRAHRFMKSPLVRCACGAVAVADGSVVAGTDVVSQLLADGRAQLEDFSHISNFEAISCTILAALLAMLAE